MNTGKRPTVTEWDIQAYVDGQLDQDTERARTVEAYLAADPEAQARVRAYTKQDAAIRARCRDILAQPVPERLRPEVIRAARVGPGGERFPTSFRFAAGLACLCCAAVVGWVAGQAPDAPLEQFADRTSAYLAEHRGTESSNSPVTLQSLSALGGAPDFATEGLELTSARRVNNGDMYEARYRDTTGRELQLFVAPDPQRHDDLLYRTREDGRKVVYWQQGPLMYALTGDFSKHDLDRFADTAIERFRDRLDGSRFAQGNRDSTSPSIQADSMRAPGDNLDPAREEQLHTSQSGLDGDASGGAAGEPAPAVRHDLDTGSPAIQ